MCWLEGSVVSDCCPQVLNPAEGLKEDYGMCEALYLSLLRQLTQLTYGHTPPCLLQWTLMSVKPPDISSGYQKQTYHTAVMWNESRPAAQRACVSSGGWDKGSMVEPLFVCAGLCHAGHTSPGVNGGLSTKPRLIVKRPHKLLIDLTGLDPNPGPVC